MCVCGACRLLDWGVVVRVGLRVGLRQGPLAGGPVWTRRVAFWVVDMGRWRGPRLGAFVGALSRAVAQAGCLWLPYSCGLACFSFRQVEPGVSGMLWPRGAAAGVAVLPVGLHVLAGGFVACRPPMVPERP